MFKSLKTAVALTFATAAVAIPTASSAAPLPTWYGSYVWEESLGRIGGDGPQDGVAAFTTYRLTLRPATRDTGCMVNIEGYQRYEQLKCTATPELDKLIIKLYKFRDSDQGRYRSGTPLFTLVRTENGIMTQLQAMDPSSDNTPRAGRLFHRG